VRTMRACTLCFVAAAAVVAVPAAAAAKHPSGGGLVAPKYILTVLADDYGYHNIGCVALAFAGVRFVICALLVVRAARSGLLREFLPETPLTHPSVDCCCARAGTTTTTSPARTCPSWRPTGSPLSATTCACAPCVHVRVALLFARQCSPGGRALMMRLMQHARLLTARPGTSIAAQPEAVFSRGGSPSMSRKTTQSMTWAARPAWICG
jgi:hypothetical protein